MLRALSIQGAPEMRETESALFASFTEKWKYYFHYYHLNI